MLNNSTATIQIIEECDAFLAGAERLVKNLRSHLANYRSKTAHPIPVEREKTADQYDLDAEIAKWEGEGGATAEGSHFRQRDPD